MNQLVLHRQLDPGEHFFWLLDRVSGMNFVIFAEIGGAIDPAHLQQALTKAQQAHPLLRTQIVQPSPGELWFAPAAVPLMFETIAVTQDDWQAPIEAELSLPFELEEAPLVRCRYLTFTDQDRSVLLLSFHHAIADGRSGTALLREILAYLAKPDSASHFQTGAVHPPMHSVFPEKYHWHLQPQSAVELIATRKSELKRHGRPSALPWLDQQQPRRMPRIKRLMLDAASTAQLMRACKNHGTTMHGALGAAQLLAKYRSLGGSDEHTLSLGSPADMRPYLAGTIPVTGLGLYVTLLQANYALGGAQSFWELARAVGSDLKRQLGRGDGHLLFAQIQPASFAPTPAGIAAFSAIMLASPQSSMISNIGVVDAVSGAGRVEAISFALCPMPYQMLFSAASTYGGRLIVNMAYDAAKLSADNADQLAQWMKQALLDAGTDGVAPAGRNSQS